ncbi:thiamine ABC transporter substrate-binding protein [bacterium]|nr:thiamine ABC transporter substrate-binding protein [bacterium]
MKPANPSELKQCQARVEGLQEKSQEQHLTLWSKLNPTLNTWNETAQGYLQSFEMVDKIEKSSEGNPESFLYSNSLESCLKFADEYSAEIKKQELYGISGFFLSVLVLVVSLVSLFRRKRTPLMLWLIFSGVVVGSKANANVNLTPVLRIYTYDALTGKNSFGEYLSETFLKKYGVKTQFVSFGTAGEALNQIVLEGEKTKADILMGIDEVLFRRFQTKGRFEKIDASIFDPIESGLKKQANSFFVPFDYGYLSFVFDESRSKIPKKLSLKEIPQYLASGKKVVLQDPRTSSIGLEFLVWTFEELQGGAKTFWQSLAPHILTVSPGWSGAYELFLRKQADLVVSYTTSPAYHHLREKKLSIKPIFFDEGHFKQVEGMVLLSSSKNKSTAVNFIKHVLGAEAQTQLPTFQWMYPARAGIQLPSEFRAILIPKSVEVNWDRVLSQKDQWVRDWTLLLSQDPK